MKPMRRGVALRSMIALASLLIAAPALGSGPEADYWTPTYIDVNGGTPAEQRRFFLGRLGVVLPAASDGMLFAQWRLLHGLSVGTEAGVGLSERCCDWEAYGQGYAGVDLWLDVRKRVIGAPEVGHIQSEQFVTDYRWVPVCHSDAFDRAASTLLDRIRTHGAGAASVRAWLNTQDAVFTACGGKPATLPSPLPDGPDWLRKDYAYQRAAFAFYSQRFAEAAELFAAIGRDPQSPWKPLAPYLVARARAHDALSPASTDRIVRLAREAIGEVQALPVGSFGRTEVRSLLRSIDYQHRPAELMVELDHELMQPRLRSDTILALRDYMSLSRKSPPRGELADWMITIRTQVKAADIEGARRRWWQTLDLGWLIEAVDRARGLNARAHARDRWTRTGDPAWLIATLALTRTDDVSAADMAREADRITPEHPGWLTGQYHLVRLSIAHVDPAPLRQRVDHVLARTDLSRGDRNLFLGVRAQLSASLSELARYAQRHPDCSADRRDCAFNAGIPDDRFARTPNGFVGLGEESRAIIDRMPLALRIDLASDPQLPGDLRLDIALTSFARAVLLQDDATIDRLMRILPDLHPTLAREWARIAATRPGPTRRFVEILAMAKMPGLRIDLHDYERPYGLNRRGSYWVKWQMMPTGTELASAKYPEAGSYRSDGIDHRYGYDNDGEDDLTCRGKCGPSGFPMHMPAFLRATRAQADRERRRLHDAKTFEEASDAIPGGIDLWEELFAYAKAHPEDPAAPEAFYWLIRITRWSFFHTDVGERAFNMLHRHHPRSEWTRKSPVWFSSY